ncbi:Bifunctional UDP-sugar hydrolase 5'-nucleotidase periplasmic [Seminavis robusta]|uniref:Bifunctional UDP-sugar hydrolase 5'-nucleotidase periplasmic n=1 Tax=Seminavis robusta TaxID=568900 RepID=A0A9N8DUB0_9STRA|nr:Bifunctional UDP-sugar hydrolase 5'-nucleotidase periplasmic [Seminavis robusta]|eukprot:Sro296_g110580.1 Bifunctional UDP-sugar hydrolase 5'-nucleotidase periplasmic (789) ;mRNA; f:1692-4058
MSSDKKPTDDDKPGTTGLNEDEVGKLGDQSGENANEEPSSESPRTPTPASVAAMPGDGGEKKLSSNESMQTDEQPSPASGIAASGATKASASTPAPQTDQVDEKEKKKNTVASLRDNLARASGSSTASSCRISRSERLSNTSCDGDDSKRRNSGMDPSLRPGAYSQAPGQEMQRNDTVEYKVYYDPSRLSSQSLPEFKELDAEEEKEEITSPFEEDDDRKPPARKSYPDKAKKSDPDKAKKGDPAAKKNAHDARLNDPAAKKTGPDAKKQDPTMAKQLDTPSLGRVTSAPQPSRLSRESLELRKAALSLTLASCRSLITSSSTKTISSILEHEKSTEFTMDNNAELSVPDPTSNFNHAYFGDIETALGAETDHTMDMTEHTSSSLPVAAEVVKSPDALEEEIRERVVEELANSCTFAEAVKAEGEAEATSKQRSWLVTVVVAVLVVVVVIVVGVVLGVVLSGTDDPEESRSTSTNTLAPTVVATTTSDVVAKQNDTSVFATNATETSSVLDDSQGSNKDDDDSVLSLLSDNSTIAVIPETICYERAPMMGWSAVCEPQTIGSAVTNLVAASRLWSIPEANISILNAGEVKSDMLEGNFTLGMAKDVLPYQSNTLVAVQLEGAYIKIVLERGLQRLFDDIDLFQTVGRAFSGGSYPYAAGIRYAVDMTQPFPRRMSNIEVYTGSSVLPPSANDDDSLWAPIQMEGVVYTVVTNSYLASGGDGFHEFNSRDFYRNETELNSLEEFVAYCQTQEILLTPSQSHFSTQSYSHDPSIKYCGCDTGVYNESTRI